MNERTGRIWSIRGANVIVRFDERRGAALESFAIEDLRGRPRVGAKVREVSGWRVDCGIRSREHKVEVVR